MSSQPESASCKACMALLDPSRRSGHKNGFDLLVCPGCGTITIHPFPTREELTAFYQAYKDKANYRSKQDKKIRRARRRIKRMMALAPGKKFLDVGCNYGFAVEAARLLGLDASGIDIDGPAIESDRKAFPLSQFKAASVEDYAAQNHKFDMVYSAEVIEHVPDADSFVQGLSKLLNSGGILYLTTPDAGHFAVPTRVETWKEVFPPEHLTYHTRQGIKLLFQKHGLKIRKFFFSFKPSLRVLAEKL
ncbi:MAG: methyltransferase domain-containing protein [Alphaproteobacteria bacterium]|nr:methyltransferase domain-containing protein [Alphaproteobacteria bacterium]